MIWTAGIDGGGTRTRAVLVDDTGTVRGLGLAGASNYNDRGEAAAGNAIAQALAEAWRQAGGTAQPLAAVFLGLAGVTSSTDRAIIARIVEHLRLVPSGRYGIDHDIRIALAGGLCGRPGLALIAGTGSACYGRAVSGATVQVGGWGALTDDVGSGYWLGWRAIGATVRAEDGRGPTTALQAPVLAHLGIVTMDDYLHRVYVMDLRRHEIAALAPTVIDCARAGDAVACRIVAEGAAELGLMAATAAQRLFAGQSCELILAGSLATHETYGQDVQREIRRQCPEVSVASDGLPPHAGAALLALELAGVPITATVLHNLKMSLDKNGLSR